jgi:hypothetical protein
LAVVLASGSAALSAQTPPLSNEFRANTYTTANQVFPAIASTGGGSFVVVWVGTQEDSGGGIFGQRFDGSGTKVGSEFHVNTHTSMTQLYPSVAGLGDGSFVVVWESDDSDGTRNIKGQRFDEAGPVGTEFRANTHTPGGQGGASVAADDAGNFVVVWGSAAQDGSGSGVFGQRFNSSGTKLGAEFPVNTYTTDSQSSPHIAALASEGFIVVWESLKQDGDGSEVFGQRLDGSGSKAGPEFHVNSFTSGRQFYPSVAAGEAGSFVVVWTSYGEQDGSLTGIFGQRFDVSGTKVGAEFRINSYTTSYQMDPDVASGRDGGFVVVWTSVGQDGSNGGIFGQRLDRRGEKVGTEFAINAQTAGDQNDAAVVDNGFGPVAVWRGPAAAPFDIFGRRPTFSAESLALDARDGADTLSDTNGVLEPGERVLLEPAWANRNAFFASLQGNLSSLSGPTGGIYLINDDSAVYDETAPNTVSSCDDGDPDACYVVTVGGARPAIHWDATAREDVSGGAHIWSVHLGDSFSDVPRTNLFYRAIETIFHEGVTSGCGGSNYCPSDPVPRDQMAIFVAKGIAGIGESVPSTGTLLSSAYDCSSGGNSLFTDVSPGASFCKHVHYLAVQNVTLGCGLLTYCPGDNITRDAMASFIAKAIVAPGGGDAVPESYTDPATNLSYSCETATPNLHFSDVPASHPFCKHIHYLWAREVVSGCSSTQYCPSQNVTRDAMAKFIANGFGVELYGP